MKTAIEFIKKYSLVILAITFCILSLSQTSCGNQSKPQQSNIAQLNKEKSKTDSLNTVKANALLQQKDCIIKVLNSKLITEKANTEKHRAESRKQHTLNDTLQAQFERNKDLSTCEDLVQGLKVEVIEKDSIIQSLDSEIVCYTDQMNELNQKVDIQKGIIDSKQNLIAYKDSTISHLATQKKKADFWNKIKIKAAGAVILFESIILLVK
jgi:hypothetical protein